MSQVYDAIPPRMTQDDQVAITLASHYLQQQGKRLYIDFGWETAVDWADALGWPAHDLPWPLYRAARLREQERETCHEPHG